MQRWTLTVIDGSEQGLEKPLNEEIILGRSLDNDLVLSHSLFRAGTPAFLRSVLWSM